MNIFAVCDRCGKEVRPRDDVRRMESLIRPGVDLVFAAPRHLRCSPSRGQFVTGLNIVEDRPQFDKRNMSEMERVILEEMWTEAYMRVSFSADECKGNLQ